MPPPKRIEMGHCTGFLGRRNYPQSWGTRPAVDKTGQTIDFLLTKQRDEKAAPQIHGERGPQAHDGVDGRAQHRHDDQPVDQPVAPVTLGQVPERVAGPVP